MNWKLIRYVDRYVGIPLAYVMFCIKKLLGYFAKEKQNEYKEILLMKFWGIGNTLMLLPAAAALKDHYPRGRLTFLTLSSNKEAVESAGLFDDTCYINTRSLVTFIVDTFAVLMHLRKRRFDLIIDFEQFARFSALLCAIIARRKTRTLGFKTQAQHRHFIYTDPVAYDNTIHMAKTFYLLAEHCGIPPTARIEPPPLKYSNDDMRTVETLLRNLRGDVTGPMVVMHVGTSKNFNLRRWPPHYFAALANKLIEAHGAKIVLTALASNDERIATDVTYAGIARKENVFNACGKLTFGQFIALIKKSNLVISADTATVHIGSCLSVPTAGLYGPNTPVLYGPWGKKSIWFYKKLDCSPCITNYNSKINECLNPLGQGACMKAISAEEVFSELENTYFGPGARYPLTK